MRKELKKLTTLLMGMALSVSLAGCGSSSSQTAFNLSSVDTFLFLGIKNTPPYGR